MDIDNNRINEGGKGLRIENDDNVTICGRPSSSAQEEEPKEAPVSSSVVADEFKTSYIHDVSQALSMIQTLIEQVHTLTKYVGTINDDMRDDIGSI